MVNSPLRNSLNIVRNVALRGTKLPNIYLKEVVHIAMYILNRAQIRVRTTRTPYESSNGKTTNVKNFKIFACKCFIKKDNDSL